MIFKADAENRSYFLENGERTSQYEFTFTVLKDSSDNTKFTITHNGSVVEQSAVEEIISNTGNDKLVINDAYRSSGASDYSGKKQFSGWSDSLTDFNTIETFVKSDSTLYYKEYTAQLTDVPST